MPSNLQEVVEVIQILPQLEDPYDIAKDPAIGLVIDGCRILEPIGLGGMATVYKAKHLLLDKIVAMKLMLMDLNHKREYVERFLSEARIAASLDHPNILQVNNVGKQHNRYFINMQYVDGNSLSHIMKNKPFLSTGTALKIAIFVAKALKVIHKRGLIHRDVKPGNVLISRDGTVKLADFGLAKTADESREVSRNGKVIGTPHFMSPEQFEGKALSPQTDHYSLGATLYYMVSGEFPFDGDSVFSIFNQHCEWPLEFDSARSKNVPELLQGLIRVMMAKKPESRFQSTGALENALIKTYRQHRVQRTRKHER